MAMFELGEAAEHIGGNDFQPGERVEVVAVGPWNVHPVNGGPFFDNSWSTTAITVDYRIRSLSDGALAYTQEKFLRKLPPKHQPDDLRVAEPHFINHQLPRWLKQEETTNAE